MKYIIYIKLKGEKEWDKISEHDSIAYVQDLIDRLSDCSEVVSIKVDLVRK